MTTKLLTLTISLSLTLSPAFAATDAKVNVTCASAKTSEQKQKFCDAAKDAHGAENASKTSAYIWGGVAAVCAYSVFSPGGAALCNKVNTGGGVADAVVKKDYTNLLSTAQTSGAAGLNQMFGKKEETPAKAAEKTNTSGEVAKTGEGTKTADKTTTPKGEKGGLSAAMIAFQAAAKVRQNKINSETAGDIVDDLAENQKDLDEGTTNVKVPTTTGAGGGNTTIVNQYTGGSGNGGNFGPSGSGSMMGGCSDAALASIGGAYNCARSRGADIPPPATVGEINDQLKQLTGKDIADYMKSGTDPMGMVNDALKNTNPEKSKELKDALLSAYNGPANSGNSGESLKFGAASAPVAPAADDDLSLKNMLQDLMAGQGAGAVGPNGELLGEATEEGAGDELTLELANRKIASELIDGYLLGEKENLFDRVHKRYSKLSRKDLIGGTNGKSQKN